jgi:hypothetical protein
MPQRDYVESAGNVFADLGLPQPDEALVNAELAQKVVVILAVRHGSAKRSATGRYTGRALQLIYCGLIECGK